MKNTFAAITLFLGSILSFYSVSAPYDAYDDDDDDESSYNSTGYLPSYMDEEDEDNDMSLPQEGAPMEDLDYFGMSDDDIEDDQDFSDDDSE